MMPMFEYKCQLCGKKTTLLQKESKPPPCECGGFMRKIISAFGFKMARVR